MSKEAGEINNIINPNKLEWRDLRNKYWRKIKQKKINLSLLTKFKASSLRCLILQKYLWPDVWRREQKEQRKDTVNLKVCFNTIQSMVECIIVHNTLHLPIFMSFVM